MIVLRDYSKMILGERKILKNCRYKRMQNYKRSKKYILSSQKSTQKAIEVFLSYQETSIISIMIK